MDNLPATESRSLGTAIPSNTTSPQSTANIACIAVVGAYLCISFVLTHIGLSGTILDYENFPSQLRLIDKVYHFFAYGFLTLLVLMAFTKPVDGQSSRDRQCSARRLLWLCAAVFVYGIFDEVTQPYFGRRFEVLDLMANCFGIAAGRLAFVVAEASGWRDRLFRLP